MPHRQVRTSRPHWARSVRRGSGSPDTFCHFVLEGRREVGAGYSEGCLCLVASYHFTPPQSIHFCSTSPLQDSSPFSSHTVPLTRSLRVCAIATRSLTPNIRYPFLCRARYLSPTLSRLTGPTIRTVREQAWGDPSRSRRRRSPIAIIRTFLTIRSFPRHRWLCSNSSKKSPRFRGQSLL